MTAGIAAAVVIAVGKRDVLGMAIPPLTDEQLELVRSASEARDHREPALFGLLDNTRLWTPDATPGDAAVRLVFDESRIRADLDQWRGELFQIRGRLEQVEPFDEPYEGVTAWFIREPSGAPRLVYVDTRPGSPEAQPGRHVVVYARFFKFITATGRDGHQREYAAFVGALPQIEGRSAALIDSAAPTPPLSVLLIAIGLLAGAALLLLVYTRTLKARSPVPAHRSARHEERFDESVEELPEDPDLALADLARRAKDQG